jgi:hypothetical protein
LAEVGQVVLADSPHLLLVAIASLLLSHQLAAGKVQAIIKEPQLEVQVGEDMDQVVEAELPARGTPAATPRIQVVVEVEEQVEQAGLPAPE